MRGYRGKVLVVDLTSGEVRKEQLPEKSYRDFIGRVGLVNKVVPPDKLEESAIELARKIASKSQTSLQVGNQFFYTMLDMEYTQATKYAAEMISILAVSEDGREGQRVFLEKRKPEWKS